MSTKLNVMTIGDLSRLSLADVKRAYPPSPENKTARFLFDVSWGVCDEEVSNRTAPKSIRCGKTFRRHLAINPADETLLRRWIGELCRELTDRLDVDWEENGQSPRLFIISTTLDVKGKGGLLSSHALRSVQCPTTTEWYVDEGVKLIRQIVKKKAVGGDPSICRIIGLAVSTMSSFLVSFASPWF